MYSIQVLGLDRIKRRIKDAPRQIRYAAARTINDTAYIGAKAVQVRMATAFDKPTPFVVRSIFPGLAKATPERLRRSIYPEGPGGKSVDPADVLHAEVFGGPRKFKRSERAFQRVGVLPAGFAMVPSRQLLKSEKADRYGNIKASFIVQLISYFQAFGEQGYKANMVAKTKRKLAKYGKSAGGFRKINGVEYFVSFGKLRSRGDLGTPQNLPAGIWSRSGTGGSNVKPIFLFVRLPVYRKRLPYAETIETAVTEAFPRLFAAHLQRALATAR